MCTRPDAQGGPAGARAERAEEGLPPETAAFYRAMIEALRSVDVPFLVGGAYAFARYTGIERHTKDFDIFVRAEDVNRVMATLAGAGCATELTFPHWLGKAYCGSDFIDVIFRSANGLAAVDEDWFAHAVEDEVLGLPVRLIPREEMLWSKAFVMERERYDGADVNHLLRAAATGPHLDPARLGRLGHRDGQHEHAVVVGGRHLARVQGVADLQLPGEAALRPLGEQDVVALLVLRAALGPDGQHVALGGDLHAARVDARQIQGDVVTVVGLPDVHRHAHRRPPARHQLAGQPIKTPEGVPERVETHHAHGHHSFLTVVVWFVRAIDPRPRGVGHPTSVGPAARAGNRPASQARPRARRYAAFVGQ